MTTKKVYDNVKLFGSKDRPESQIERERRAELSLLYLLETTPESEHQVLLAALGVPEGELKHLKQKWSRVLDRYRAEKAKEAQNDTQS